MFIAIESDKPPEQVPSSLFQRTRVDRLLGLLTEKFPPDTVVEQKPNIQDIKPGILYVLFIIDNLTVITT